MNDVTIPLLASQAMAQSQVGAAQHGARALAGSGDKSTIEKPAREFEAILLTQWLQQAEDSFARLPGGEDEDNESPGSDQFRSLSLQAVAGAITKGQGIGIASMIVKHTAGKGAPDPGTRVNTGPDEGKML